MTNLIRFLLRSSRWTCLLAVLSGIVGGAGGVALLALIPAALHADASETGRLGLAFAAVCLLTIAARVATQVTMIRLAQASVVALVQHLCERILALPLRQFEANEPGRLTAVLTEDVVVLTNALA